VIRKNEVSFLRKPLPDRGVAKRGSNFSAPQIQNQTVGENDLLCVAPACCECVGSGNRQSPAGSAAKPGHAQPAIAADAEPASGFDKFPKANNTASIATSAGHNSRSTSVCGTHLLVYQRITRA
jgi:hypothetical protein